MAMYTCEECGDFIDDDEEPGLEYKGGLICPSCVDSIWNEVECMEDEDQPVNLTTMSDEELLSWYIANV